MMITDQISAAVAAVLTASGLPNSPAIHRMVSDAENAEEACRIIVTSTTSELRKPSLPGIYDVSGEVVIQQSIAAEGALAGFQSVCNAVRQVIGSKSMMPVHIGTQDQSLRVFSWNLTGQESTNTARSFLARLTWTACARQDPHNPY